MAETGGYGRFPGSLDPRAQEFRPRHSTTVFMPQPQQVFFPYSSPYPPISDVPLLPFCEGGVTYAPYPTPAPAYVPVRSAGQAVSSVATRSLVVSSVPCDVSETMVRRELEAFGDVRGVQMERVNEGIVIVHFYDIRHAERALREIRDQHMQHQCRLRNYFNNANANANANTNNRFLFSNSATQFHDFPLPRPSPAPGLIAGQAVWAQFVVPASNAVPAGKNQGTIVVFNLDSTVSTSCLREIFEAFGPVKELRETPLKKHQRFVEFFDIRDAGKALKEMNGKEINGKSVMIEFSRPGGHGNKFFNANLTAPAICGSNNLYPRSLKSPPPPPPPPTPPRNFSGGAASNVPPRWYYSKPHSFSRKLNLNKGSRSPSNLRKSLDSNDVNGKMASLALEGTVCNEIEERESCGDLRKNSKTSHSSPAFAAEQEQQQEQEREQQQLQPQQLQPSRSKLRKCRQSKKFDSRFLINDNNMVDSDCRDSRTTVMIKNIPNKYSQKLLLNMLDNHCIHCNEQMGDGHNQPLSSYDFVYLPIDFNNKCNVGYGFVNMTSPEATWRLYKAFHLQPWEVFNSRKICEVTYARVQGREALKEHFKNSKFPCEMDHYLPVVFSPPRDGRQLTEPLPLGGQKQPISIGLSTTPSPSPSSGNDEMDGEDDDDEVAATATTVVDRQEEAMNGSSSSQSGGGVDEEYDQNEVS